MIGDLLRSVTQSEEEAEKIIVEAKEKAMQIKNGVKDDIAAKKTSEGVALAEESEMRKVAVKEEEERKDKEYTLKVTEELEALSAKASEQEDHIVGVLAERIYSM